jgi:hypothetical protein
LDADQRADRVRDGGRGPAEQQWAHGGAVKASVSLAATNDTPMWNVA